VELARSLVLVISYIIVDESVTVEKTGALIVLGTVQQTGSQVVGGVLHVPRVSLYIMCQSTPPIRITDVLAWRSVQVKTSVVVCIRILRRYINVFHLLIAPSLAALIRQLHGVEFDDCIYLFYNWFTITRYLIKFITSLHL